MTFFHRFVLITFAASLVLAPVGAGAQGNIRLPDLGDVSQSVLTPAQEQKLGASIVRQLRAEGAYLNDPEVNDYLDSLGHRLVAAVDDTRQNFEFFAINDDTVNAFALPGGYIGVNTGLILLTQNESELASVLAHEITHVTQHHASRQMSGQKDMLLLTLAALAAAMAAAAASSSDQAAMAAVAGTQALAIQSQINYTREHEYEADRIGFQRLEAAGFDPSATATFMSRLLRSNRFNDGKMPSYLRTHPLTTERIAEAQARAAGRPYRQVMDSLDFQLVRALLRSYQGTAREAQAYFENNLKERKFSNEAAMHYGLAAAALRVPNIRLARDNIAWLDQHGLQSPMIEALAGHVLMEGGDIEGALKRWNTARQKYPNKKQLVYDVPSALIKAGRAQEAAADLERSIIRFPDDGLLHQLAAKAYAQLNQPFREHRHLGEYYAWAGALRVAAEQFEIALKQPGASFQEQSAVESRLRDIRDLIADGKRQ